MSSFCCRACLSHSSRNSRNQPLWGRSWPTRLRCCPPTTWTRGYSGDRLPLPGHVRSLCRHRGGDAVAAPIVERHSDGVALQSLAAGDFGIRSRISCLRDSCRLANDAQLGIILWMRETPTQQFLKSVKLTDTIPIETAATDSACVAKALPRICCRRSLRPILWIPQALT